MYWEQREGWRTRREEDGRGWGKTAGDVAQGSVPIYPFPLPGRYMRCVTTVKSSYPSFACVLLTVNAVFFIASSSLSFLAHMICGLVMIASPLARQHDEKDQRWSSTEERGSGRTELK
jgi:hypothetical protein